MSNYFQQLYKIKPKAKDVIQSLYKVPKRDVGVNAPKIQDLEAGQVQQADLLTLPNDNGFKYALVVVDTASKIKDAEPIKNKTAKTVLAAFKKIYARKILEIPKSQIEVDAGGEFRGDVSKYFKDNNVSIRVAKAGRHRQQGLVERTNQIIGQVLFKRMTAQELATGETSREWVDDLPQLITVMNKKLVGKKVKVSKNLKPVCEGDACKILPRGTKVRVALDNPKDVIGNKLHGRFRSTDIRWAPEIRIIKEILLKPNSPPMYLLDGNVGKRLVEPVAYTKSQLQVVGKELMPDERILRGKHKGKYIIEKLLDRKKIGGVIKYSVQWVGYEKATWESRQKLVQDVPKLVEEYDKQNP